MRLSVGCLYICRFCIFWVIYLCLFIVHCLFVCFCPLFIWKVYSLFACDYPLFARVYPLCFCLHVFILCLCPNVYLSFIFYLLGVKAVLAVALLDSSPAGGQEKPKLNDLARGISSHLHNRPSAAPASPAGWRLVRLLWRQCLATFCLPFSRSGGIRRRSHSCRY